MLQAPIFVRTSVQQVQVVPVRGPCKLAHEDGSCGANAELVHATCRVVVDCAQIAIDLNLSISKGEFHCGVLRDGGRKAARRFTVTEHLATD